MDALLRKIESQLAGLPVPVAVELPAGKRVGPPAAAVKLSFKDWSSLARMAAGQIGRIAEDFVENRVQLEGRMRDLMAVAARLLPGTPVNSDTSWWTQMLRRAKSAASHSQHKDAQQVQFHYDVSDDFYALWLDPRRVYSCAYYRDIDMSLAQAQEAKLDHICRKLMLRPGEKFLDIGAGWGGLLMWAAENYGVNATGITLSKNQHVHVQRLIEEKGLQGRVRMQLRDYREMNEAEGFDKIASVGMFEHVGQVNMPAYFGKIFRLLKPGGLVMNHGITAGSINPGQLGAGWASSSRNTSSPAANCCTSATCCGRWRWPAWKRSMSKACARTMREPYGPGPTRWRSSLGEAQRVLETTGNVEDASKVLRAYRLYLAGCAMTFEQGWIGLHQILATRPDGQLQTGSIRGAQSTYPFNREYMYPSSR